MPIYEAKFSEGSYGYRPNRSAKDAINKVKEYAEAGYKYAYTVTLSTGAVGIKLVPTVDDNWSTGTTTGM